ncbi:MAG: SemiSWEET transporter [Thermoplasmata archaeon]
MDGFTILGLIAGTLTTSGYIPQIVKGYRTKKMQDVSLMMISILCIGMFLWILYGLSQSDIPLIVSNTVGTSFLVTLIAMKFYYDRRLRLTGLGNQ